MPRRAKTRAFNDLYWIPAGRSDKGWSGPGILVGDPPITFVQLYSQDVCIYHLASVDMDYRYYPATLHRSFRRLRNERGGQPGSMTVQLLDPITGSRERTMELVSYLREIPPIIRSTNSPAMSF